MNILEVSQIIFNVVISLAVILITTLFSIIAYETIKFIKLTKMFLAGVNHESSEIYNKINKFLEGIFSLSLISKFFTKKKIKINK